MGDPLPQPTNRLLNIVQTVLEQLIEGVGVELAVAAAVSAEPWLATPFVNYIFKWIVGLIASYLDANLFKLAIKAVIRVQSDVRKQEFNDALKPIIDGSPTDAEIKAARDAADRIIERNR